MAGNAKSNSKKKNNTVVKNTKKKTTKKNTTKKATTKATNKKNTVKKNVTKKPVKKEVVKTQEKKEQVVKKTSKKQEPNIVVEFRSLKKLFLEKKKELLKKYKECSKPIKWLIIVCLICSVILIIEGILFATHNSHSNNNMTFHDSYNGIVTDDGNVVVVGSSDFKYSELNTYTKGNDRGKLVKYNSAGEIVFEKAYEKGLATAFKDVISVSDGYVVVGTGVFSEEEKDNEAKEAFILKFDKNGNLVWEKFYQVLTDTSFNKVIEVADGYIAVGQSIYANMELGNHTTGGGIIVKYDRDGNEIWHNNHGGSKSGNFNGLVVVNNDIYVVGKDGADSANLVKFNASGEYQWHKNYSYTDAFGFGGIAYLDNGLYVVGSKKILPPGTGDDDDRSTANTDAVLIKYDLDGNIVFEKTFGGSGFERYNTIVMYHGNFYVVGHICSHDAGLRVTNDDPNEMTGLMVRYDRNGNILKKETFGGSNNDNLTGIATDGISFYAIGYSNSKDGNITTTRSNGKDYFGELIKVNFRFKKIYSK